MFGQQLGNHPEANEKREEENCGWRIDQSDKHPH
jgi:hypothetical protein